MSAGTLKRYAMAILATVVSTVFRALADPILGNTVPFVLHFPGIVVSAWFGGFGPGLLATGLSMLLAWYFFIQPYWSFSSAYPTTIPQVILFGLAGTMISMVAERGRASQRRSDELAERLRVTLSSIGDAVIATDAEGRVTFLNEVATALTGWTLGEAREKPLREVFRIVNEKTRAKVEDPAARILREGTAFDLADHSVLIARDGSERVIDDSGAPIKSAEGEMLGAVLVFRDVTEKRKIQERLSRADDALRGSEARFRTMADLAPVLVWMSETDGRRRFFNRPWLEFTGRKMEQELGNGWTESLHPDDVDSYLTAYSASISARSDFETEHRLRRFDGEYRWVIDRGVPLYGGAAEFTGYIGSSIDITDRKRAEETIRSLLEREQAARSQAEEANRAKDEFLATVSHELRTPLNAILGWTKLLGTGQLADEKAREALEIVERNAKAQAQLIEDILDVSRIISGKVRLDVRSVELASVIESALTTVRLAADAKGVQIHSVVDPRAGPISGDSARLQQIVWNLISNAIKFTPRGGRIQVTVERVNSHAEIAVSDTGKGIGAEFLPYVFERFRQGQAGTTREHGGLGLGLAIVRHLVELHGGNVRAESLGEGRGATFVVRLPLAVVRSAVKDERSHPTADVRVVPAYAHPPRLSGIRILVIDDEPDTRRLLREVLEGFGAEVRDADSAQKGLDEAVEWRPAAVVCDIGMPGEDGYSFIEKLREKERLEKTWTPAVALTAYARLQDRVRALSVGFQVHVAKPIDPLELGLIVLGLVERRREGEGLN